MNPARLALAYRSFTSLVVVLAILGGMIGMVLLPRQEDPDVSPPWATVVVPYPGATAQQVETLIVRPVEQRIQEITGIKNLYSYARPGAAVLVIHLEDGVDRDKAWSDLRRKASDVRSELPPEIGQIEINTTMADTVTMLITVAGPYEHGRLAQFGRDLQRKIEIVPAVGRVELIGVPAEEVFVGLQVRSFVHSGITPWQVVGALKEQGGVLPGGKLQMGGLSYPLEVMAGFRSLSDVQRVVVGVSEQGHPVMLMDVANVAKGIVADSPLVRSNGLPAVVVAVTARENTNITTMGQRVREIVSRFKEELPAGMDVRIIADQPAAVDKRLASLGRNLVSGMSVVVLIVAIAMGLRNALVVSTVIPVSVIISTGMMYLLGIKIHQVSIAAIIIALGMLVDNAIVVVDNINRHRQEGKGRHEAVVLGFQEVGAPILTATLTTVAAFIPLMLMSGDVGDFVRSIPQVVTISLLASLVIAATFVPLLSFWLLRDGRQYGNGAFSILLGVYSKALRSCLARPKLTVGAGVLALAISLGGLPLLGLQFFPPGDRQEIIVEVWSPRGSPLVKTDGLVGEVERMIEGMEGVDGYTVFIGRGIPKFYYNLIPVANSSNLAQFLVNVRKDAKVEEVSSRLRAGARDVEHVGQIQVRRLEQGPPAGAAISIRIKGEDTEQLRILAAQTRQRISGIAGIVNIDDDYTEAPQISLKVDQDRARFLGISDMDISRTVRLITDGVQVGTIFTGDRQLPVMARLITTEQGIGGIAEVPVHRLNGGGWVSMAEVADYTMEWQLGQIIRHNGTRAVTVRSDVSGRLTADVQREVLAAINSMSLPQGYSVQLVGENADRDTSFRSLGKAAIFAVMLIYILLVLQFNSLKQPLIVLATIPMALIGTVLGLGLTGYPIGFMALLGVVSLCGIVVNNAIVLVDFINNRRRQGYGLTESLVDGCEKRLCPVLLTTITTTGGLLPLTLSGGSLWGPLGWALIGGLSISTVLTLLVVPCLYYLTERNSSLFHREQGLV